MDAKRSKHRPPLHTLSADARWDEPPHPSRLHPPEPYCCEVGFLSRSTPSETEDEMEFGRDGNFYNRAATAASRHVGYRQVAGNWSGLRTAAQMLAYDSPEGLGRMGALVGKRAQGRLSLRASTGPFTPFTMCRGARSLPDSISAMPCIQLLWGAGKLNPVGLHSAHFLWASF